MLNIQKINGSTDHPSQTTVAPKDEICESLKRSDESKLNILAVGIANKRMLLITQDFYVYDVPIESIDTSINQLYLHSKPVSMAEKFPVLFNDQRFNRIKNHIFNAFIMKDRDSEWLCFTTWYRKFRENGVNYDLRNSRVIIGWTFYDSVPEVLISTEEPCRFYSLNHDYYGNLRMTKYQCNRNNRVMDRPGILPSMPFRPVCFDDDGPADGKQRITIETSGSVCRSGLPVRWPVLKGFTANHKFYLFGPQYIYIFDENVFDQRNAFAITNRSYDSFFNCSSFIPQGEIISHKFLYWLIAAIIILLIILMIIIWCILVTSRDHAGHRKLKPFDSSFIHAKTARSSAIRHQSGGQSIVQKLSYNNRSSMVPTQPSNNNRSSMLISTMATMRSGQKNQSRNSILGHKKPLGSAATMISRSTQATVRTGIDSNNSNDNEFKYLTHTISQLNR